MSLQVEHKTEKGTVLFVKSPVFFNNFKLKKLWCNFLRFDFNNSYQDIVIENGNWQMIGLTSEVTNLTALKIVDQMNWGVSCYKNYNLNQEQQFVGLSPLGSFKSLMQHLHINESEKWIVLFKEN